MNILYIFPHPDDESFGPALAMSQQVREGHAVHLLTLTHGGATKVRSNLGLSVEAMGKVRLEEMEKVKQVVGLASLVVWDYPDGDLKQADPIALVSRIQSHIIQVGADIVVTYAIGGISGHADHLTCHAWVKYAYCAVKAEAWSKNEAQSLKRLAFFTLTEEMALRARKLDDNRRLAFSKETDIGCRVKGNAQDLQTLHDALGCYATYQEIIHKYGVLETIGDEAVFELFQETLPNPLVSLTQVL